MLARFLRSAAVASLLAIPAFGHDGCDLSLPRCDFRVGSERVWVEPRFETRVVGLDRCGRPIRHRVLVRAGHWSSRTVYFRRIGATCCR
jgi:hypothetical protein